MNTNPIVSKEAAVDLSGKEFLRVKLTSTGIDLCGAADRGIGTLVRGAAAGAAVAVQLDNANGIQFAKIGTTTSLAQADELEQAAEGLLEAYDSGTKVAIVWEGSDSSDGATIRVLAI